MIEKVDFLEIWHPACEKAITEKNIRSAWRKAGYLTGDKSVDPDIVLYQLADKDVKARKKEEEDLQKIVTLALILEDLPLEISPQPTKSLSQLSSRPTTSGGPLLNLIPTTPTTIIELERMLKEVEEGTITEEKKLILI